MKASNNLTMIYDDSCPMCNIYTKAFTKNKWINSRCGFSTVSDDILSTLDLEKSKNEIPLYDASTHTTVYGIDALLKVLGSRFHIFRPLFSLTIFRFLLKKLYYLISYNRRIIAGTLPADKGFDCTPAVNVKYRIIYLIIAGTLGMLLFNAGGMLMLGAILGTFILASALFHQKGLDYSGHVTTIFLLTGFLSFILCSFLTFYLVLGLTLFFFIFFLIKRVQLIQKIHKEQGHFRVGFVIAKTCIEIGKLFLLFRSKRYTRKNLPE